MNKQELIAKVADKAGVTKAQAQACVDAFVDVVTDALKDGDEIRLVGFGTFSAPMRKERTVRVPGTGETRTLPAMRVPKFKPGKGLKDTVAG